MLLSFVTSGLPGNRFYSKSTVRPIFLLSSIFTVIDKLQIAIEQDFIYDSILLCREYKE